MDKQLITAQLRAYVERKGSQRKAAASLEGVSPATISKILSGTDLGSISNEMWRSIAAQIGTKKDTEWKMAETSASEDLRFYLEEAKNESIVCAVVGAAGCGKSQTIQQFAKSHKGVHLISCMDHWNRRVFVGKLLKSLGVSYTSTSISEMMEEVVDALNKMEAPIIVLDEADKLSDPLLYFFITLYNELEGRCGIVLCATAHLEKRILRGVRLGKKGYEEIFSRLGRKFIALSPIDDEDVALVCRENGVKSLRAIQEIISECEGDLRRVKRAVWKLKKEEAHGEGIL